MTRRVAFCIASGLFVLSGFTGLCYETVWFKRLGHLWGSSSLAMASVIAAFLLGLGLGARAFGAFADRVRRPLAWYGVFEIAIGVLALVIPKEIAWLFERVAPLVSQFSDSPLLLSAIRLTLTFAILGPPCVLMGATLPLLTRQLASAQLGVGKSAAWLYAFNTLGAALGAFVAGFVLLDTLGLVWTNALAVTINFAIGIAALAVARRASVSIESTSEVPRVATAAHTPLTNVLAVALVTGAASISLQMLWARELALLVGPTTYAFSSCLCVFILGVGLGGLLVRLLLERPAALEISLCAASLIVVLPTLAAWSLTGQLADIVGYLRHARTDMTFNAVLCSATSAALEFAPTLGMGMLFPALVELTRSSADHAGRAVGRVYAWNTIGSVAGAALTSIALVPSIGSFWSVRLALGAYALAPVALFGARGPALGTTVIAAIALLAQWRPHDPLDTNMGAYLYGTEAADAARAAFKPLMFAEGPSCNVLVLEGAPQPSPYLSRPPERLLNLRVHGKIDAGSANDMPMQLGMSYIPRMLRPKARDVAVIGMGSGVTVGAAAVFPQTEVTCCEIEPAIVEGARLFDTFNHGALERDNVHVVLDDGRSFIQGSAKRWDLILSEPSNPWIAGVANLFTAEFYRTAKARLNPNGLFAQWVQTYSFTATDFALVLRTLSSVFPHCTLIRVNGYDTLLVAGAEPVRPGYDELLAAQALFDACPEAKGDLERYFETNDVRSLLLARMLLDEKGVARFATAIGGDTVNTDENMRLELDAPRRLFQPLGESALEITQLLYRSADPLWIQRTFSEWRCDAQQVAGLRQLKTQFLQNGALAQGGALVALGLAYDSEDAELIADNLLFSDDLDQTEFDLLLARLLDAAPGEAHRLGQSLLQRGQFNAAKLVYERTLAKFPNSATAQLALAEALQALKRDGEARAALERAQDLDPLLDPLLGAGD